MDQVSDRIDHKNAFLKKLQSLKALNLPSNSYAITGSGPLAIRGLREAHDIDLIVKENLWNVLSKNYPVDEKGFIKIGDIEITKNCLNLTPQLNEIIDNCDWIRGYPFIRLEDTVLWKQYLNRPKDQADIKLIEDFLKLVPGVYKNKPKNFIPDLCSVACYLRYDKYYLFLQKAKGHWSEHKWGIPCGKLNPHEDIRIGMTRELEEEVGLKVDPTLLTSKNLLYVVSPERVCYYFHTFSYCLTEKIAIRLSDEHQNFRWVTSEEAFSFELIPGQKEAMSYETW
jgi:8-oxo-dGTP pyrophosphatase MutT (NUDIX family)